jgi:hypothetical protein
MTCVERLSALCEQRHINYECGQPDQSKSVLLKNIFKKIMDPLDLPAPDPIDIRIGSYFSTAWKLAGAVFVLAGLATAAVNIIGGIILLLIGILIITTHYRLTIDFNRHTYHDYLWVLWMRNGDKGNFEQIEYIYITKSRVSQTMASRATQSTFVRDDFNAYLKLSGNVKIHLSSNESKKDLLNTMQDIALKLKCEVVDYTIEQR